MSISQANRFLRILTSPLGDSDILLLEFKGSNALSTLFEYQLELLAKLKNVQANQIVGKPLSFALYQAGKPVQYFHGYISQFAIGEIDLHGYCSYRLTLMPWPWFLLQTLDCRIFQNKTVPAIVQKICQRFGFSANLKLQLNNSYQPREYCVQYRESAFGFIARLLAEEGIFYYFTTDSSGHTLILADQNIAFKASEPKTLVYATGSLAKHHFYTWRHQYAYAAGKSSLTDYDFTNPDTDLAVSCNGILKLPNEQKYELYNYPGGYVAKAAGSTRAKSVMQQIEAGANSVTAASGYKHLLAGAKFNLQKHPNAQEQGDYIVTAITHYASQPTVFNNQSESHYHNELTCIPAQVNYRTTTAFAKPVIHGLQNAIVVGPSDQAIYTDKFGRIKVQFIWDRQGQKDANSSCWIRVAQHWTGNGWGMQFIPRVGQEVLVAFLEGDPDRPVVVSCVYNGNNALPYDPSQQDLLFQSGIKTQSQQGSHSTFNELRFDDKQNAEQFYLHAQKDFVREVKNDDTLTVAHDQTITITNNRTEQVKQGNESIAIEQGNRTVTVKTGNDTHEINQGNRVVTLDAGNDTLEIKQGDRSVSLSMGNDQLKLSQGNHTIQVSLGKSSIEAMQGIELTVGENSIKIDQTGITISGLMIKLQGETMIQVEADAMLTLKGGITLIN